MITVLMATRNRAGILERVLDRYTQLTAAPDDWQLLIVDNGSTDGTPEVVRRFAGKLPVTYMFEPQPGKSRAVDSGLRRAAGDLILFTDDDGLPSAGWLGHYADAAAALPDYDIFGGPVLLNWPFEPPSWAVCDNTVRGWCFAHTDPAISTGPWDGLLIGSNFAVRARARTGSQGFNPALGPAPGSYAMGNETDFIERLRRAGYKAWWIGDAVVEHIIRPEQLSKAWMLRRAIWAGRGAYRLALMNEAPPTLIAGLPRWVIRSLVAQVARFAAAWIRRDERDAFLARWFLNFDRGILIEARRMRLEGVPR